MLNKISAISQKISQNLRFKVITILLLSLIQTVYAADDNTDNSTFTSGELPITTSTGATSISGSGWERPVSTINNSAVEEVMENVDNLQMAMIKVQENIAKLQTTVQALETLEITVCSNYEALEVAQREEYTKMKATIERLEKEIADLKEQFTSVTIAHRSIAILPEDESVFTTNNSELREPLLSPHQTQKPPLSSLAVCTMSLVMGAAGAAAVIAATQQRCSIS